MNVVMWIIQILFAGHTLIGALWKFSNPADSAVPSLSAISPSLWTVLSVLEIICAVFLIIPIFKKGLSKLAPIGAAGIAIEMLAFCGLHIASGDPNYGPMIYWLVVAVVGLFIAYYRARKI